MSDKNYVESIVEASRAPAAVEGRLLAPKDWAEIQPRQVAPVVVGTLTGFIDFVTANIDALALDKVVAHVADPGAIWLATAIAPSDGHYQRHHYVKASTDMVGPCPLTFNQWMEPESFIIALMSGFPTDTDAEEERQSLLKFVASIKENDVVETVDTTIAQEVKTGRGLAYTGAVAAKNPWRLRPYRTFREVEQPASTFVLRLRKAPSGDRPLCALFEAEGGQWKLDAVLNIAKYLREKLPTTVKVIA